MAKHIRKYFSSVFPQNLLFLASVWTGCLLGPDACRHLWPRPWDFSSILPFCWILCLSFSVFPLSLSLSLFGTIHIPLASGEKVQNRSVFESCMSGTDSTSGNRILGWKSFSLGILLVLLHSLSAFTASVQIWHAFMNPVSLYVTCLYFLDAFIGTFYFLKFHDENLKIRKWIISSKMVMVSNKLLW